MAKVEMKKIELIAFFKDCRSIMERLQRRGVVELTNVTDEKLEKISGNASVSQIERMLSSVNNASEILNYYSPKKEPLTSMLNGRKAISTKEFAKRKEKTKDTLRISAKINEYETKINELKNEIQKSKIKIDSLKPWLNLKLPQNFCGTKTTDVFFGAVLGKESIDDIAEKISKKNKNTDFYIEEISRQKEQFCIFVISRKEESEKTLKSLKEIGFVQMISSSSLTSEDESQKLRNDILKYEKEIKRNEDLIRAFSSEKENIDFLKDYLVMKRDKYKAFSNLAMSKNTVIINGYIPKKYADKLICEFESKYELFIDIFDPKDSDDVPVLLSNSAFSEPVEGITEMYALPNKRDVDPSSVMSFFYYLFFGMMLSDAGYGFLMLIATTIILKKTTVEGNLKKSITMFRNCGVSTLFWGALFGSWFGDLPQVIASNFFGKTITTTALWFEPLDKPIKLLLFSFGLGILHLFLGLWVNFKMLLKEGKPFDAFCEVFPIYFTILGVAPIGASILTTVPPILINWGKYLAILGVILIVLTAGRSKKNIFMRFFGGIYGLYNVATGYLGDILSYSRLLALGLATGSIASVINLIATMPQNTILKAIMLIVVGIVGHTANLGINLLGAYVHADRLQFVELFSKFYEGGGRKFEPLKSNTKYIKFEKENIYE